MSTQKHSSRGKFGFTESVLPRLTLGENECWVFTGATANGYGIAWTGQKTAPAHRLSYLDFFGEIESGLTLDHICRNRACCNPFHLEQVTRAENTMRGMGPCAIKARQTHCSKGHALNKDNLTPSDYAKGKRRLVGCTMMPVSRCFTSCERHTASAPTKSK